MITSDPEFNKALDYLLHTSYDLFIDGPAGTGKSVMIEIAYRLLKGGKLVLGSTGVAASHLADSGIPASTIHCGLKIRTQDIFSRYFDPTNQGDIQGCSILSGIDIVIIEEVGMVSASLFDHIGVLVEEAERIRKKPIRVICFGDVLQLPPVVKDTPEIEKYYRHRYYGNKFFFNSEFYLNRGFAHIPLSTIYRQSQTSLQSILNRIRIKEETDEDLSIINQRICPLSEFKEEHPLSLILASTTLTVKSLNERFSQPSKKARKFTYSAVTSGAFSWEDAGLVERQVTIWEGQQVMCIHNEIGSFQNGTLCRVIRVFPEAVLAVKADGTEITIGKHKWTQYNYNYNKKSGEVKISEVGAAVQIGCKPAAASTIHKAQGLTLESVYMNLVDNWIPESGVYLGLSRCKTLEGIGLNREIHHSDIRVLTEPINFLANS